MPFSEDDVVEDAQPLEEARFTVEGVFQGSPKAPRELAGRTVRMTIESQGKLYHGWFVIEDVEDEL